jgi:isoleucyl-tRNA synthetase
VHLERLPDVDGLTNPDIIGTWERLLKVREDVNAALEQKRKEKVIGNSLGAHVVVTASGPIAALLEAHRDQLPMLLIVSDLELRIESTDGPDTVRVDVEKARGVKCERCWRYVPSVRSEPQWSGICDRCVEALAEAL